MEDWCVKSAHLGHLRVDVKWIPVVAKTVEESLVLLSRLFLDEVSSTLWDRRESLLDRSLVAEATKTADEQAGPDSGVKLACLF